MIKFFILLILSFSLLTTPFSGSSAKTVSQTPGAPTIQASGGNQCLQSLTPSDIEILGEILDLREDLASSEKSNDLLLAKVNEINKKFPGEKRDAALAYLGVSVQAIYTEATKKARNLAILNGSGKLSQKEKDFLSGAIADATKKGVDLVASIEREAELKKSSANKLTSMGAKINLSGEWEFPSDFNFAEIRKNPELLSALKSFFPDEVKELFAPGRVATRVGNVMVINRPIKGVQGEAAKDNKNWTWETKNLAEYSTDVTRIKDSFFSKAQEYLKIVNENFHWTNQTAAALDSCSGSGIKFMFLGPLAPVIDHLTGMDKKQEEQTANINKQKQIHIDLSRILNELVELGTPMEIRRELFSVMQKITNRVATITEEGLDGMKRAYTAITLAPAAAIGAVATGGAAVGALGAIAAGTATTGTALTLASTAVTVATLATPVVVATKRINRAIKNGDGAFCSIVKYGADVPVSFVEELKWSAIGPVVQAASPIVATGGNLAEKILNFSGNPITQLALIVPEATGSVIDLKSKNEKISNIEFAIDDAKKKGDTRHLAVLEEMLENAKLEKWETVLSLAESSIGALEAIDSAVKRRRNSTNEAALNETEITTKNNSTESSTLTTPQKKKTEIFLEAKSGDIISTQLTDIHPGQPNVGKDQVQTMVDNMIKDAHKKFPNDPEAVKKFMQEVADKKVFLVDIMPDGTVLLKDGHHRASSFQEQVLLGLLDANEFKPKLKVGHNYMTDPAFTSLPPEEAMEKALEKLYKDNAIYLPETAREAIHKNEMSVSEAFRTHIPQSLDKLGNQKSRSFVGMIHYELGIPNDHLVNFMEFYSAENLQTFGVTLPRDLSVNDPAYRKKLMGELVKSPKYIEYLKNNLRPGLPSDVKAKTLRDLDTIADQGRAYFTKFDHYTRALIQANPHLKVEIERTGIAPFKTDASPEDWSNHFFEHFKKRLGPNITKPGSARAPSSSYFMQKIENLILPLDIRSNMINRLTHPKVA